MVEDEAIYRDDLKKHLSRFSEEKSVLFDVTEYTDGAEFLNNFNHGFDLIFLDIRMPYIDGMSAAHKIRETDPNVKLIFITSLAQYAIEGYAVSASDFILKPVEYGDFSLKLSKVIRQIGKDGNSIVIKTKTSKVKLAVDKILYVESQGHTITYVYESSAGLVAVERYAPLKLAAKEMNDDKFVYCNSCYLVNLRYVKEINNDGVSIGDTVLGVSKAKKKAFISAWNEYVSSK